jgi:protein-arginine kinase activator protein McsA
MVSATSGSLREMETLVCKTCATFNSFIEFGQHLGCFDFVIEFEPDVAITLDSVDATKLFHRKITGGMDMNRVILLLCHQRSSS